MLFVNDIHSPPCLNSNLEETLSYIYFFCGQKKFGIVLCDRLTFSNICDGTYLVELID